MWYLKTFETVFTVLVALIWGWLPGILVGILLLIFG